MGVGYFESLFPIGSVRGGGKGMEGSEARQWQEPVVKRCLHHCDQEEGTEGPMSHLRKYPTEPTSYEVS